MNKSFYFFLVTGAILITGIFLMSSSSQKHQHTHKKPINYQSKFDQLLSAFTEGEVDRNSKIRVRFQHEVMRDEKKVGKIVREQLFQFSPMMSGETKWIDSRTIEFTPKILLSSGTMYHATLKLDELIESLPDSLKKFRFSFHTVQQEYNLEVYGLKDVVSKDNHKKLEGIIRTTSFENGAKIEKSFKARYKKQNIDVRWLHSATGKEHYFTLDGLKRENIENKLYLSFNSSENREAIRLYETVTIPARQDFFLVSYKSYDEDKQYITLEFSDKIKSGQILRDYIELVNVGQVEYVLDRQIVKIYPKARVIGDIKIKISSDLQNKNGKLLGKTETLNFTFEEPTPAISITKSETIVPYANQLPVTFSTISLQAVDIRIIKIHEKNIPQFLQLNKLDGNDELRRVGEVIVNKKISLKKNKKVFNKNWVKHTIDLSKYVSPEPGAIYRMSLGFKRSYALCSCSETFTKDTKGMLNVGQDWDEDEESSNWDSYESPSYWEDSDDPCDKNFYKKSKAISRNILGSNLGIIVKGNQQREFVVVVNDLLSTTPKENVKVNFYNYQQRIIGSARTNASGIAKLKLTSKPYLVVASQGKHKGYLKVDNYSHLSLSRFDIGGQHSSKGVKGFIYGERGVWRPGDTVHLSFVLEDLNKTIPNKHPINVSFYDAKGSLVKKLTSKKSNKSIYYFPLPTSVDGPTGNYLANVSIGGHEFQASLKVETIIPNRLKIKLDFDKKDIQIGENIKAKLKSTWLHGAPAKNLRAEVKATLRQIPTKFKTFSEYTFDNPENRFNPETITIFNQHLDAEGEARINTSLHHNEQATGMLKAVFKTRIFEPGGNFSTDVWSEKVHPFDYYTGIRVPRGDKSRGMLLTDKVHKVNIVTLNPQGEKVTNKKVVLELYKLDWRWWWEESNDELSYNKQSTHQLIQKDTLHLQNGENDWELEIKYPEWGRYLIKATAENGHSASKTVYIDWPGWAGRGTGNNSAGAKMLNFTSDKKQYESGDKVTLNIPSGFKGKALISIEQGSKVLKTFWVNAAKGMTKCSFTATTAMAPNVYAHVTLIQPHGQSVNDLPIRMYGIIPLKVVNPKTVLSPIIDMKDELKPEEYFNVTVSEAQGKAMYYSLAVVDEGLLGLTRYRTPSVWSEFNKKQALSVKTWDLYDDVAGAEKTNHNFLSIGGDGSNSKKDGAKQNRFKPVVKYIGPFYLPKGKKTHRIKMPNYIGEVRVMLVAAHQGSYGRVAKSAKVKMPVMVLGTLPRVLGPNETLEFPVQVFSMLKGHQKVEVSIESNDYFTIEGESKKQISFNNSGENEVKFNLRVKDKVGIGYLKVVAKNKAEIAYYETDILIRSPYLPIKRTKQYTVRPGEKLQDVLGMVTANGTHRVTVESSTIPSLNLSGRLGYLIRYPYGCIEQTTSGAFPQLYLSQLLTLDKKKKEAIDKNIKHAINRIKKFQTYEGGFAYWPGQQNTNEWGTNYAGHFLLEAKLKGYTIPSTLFTSWQEFQIKKARNYTSGTNDEAQAYRLYLLSLSQHAEIGAMNKLKQNKELNAISQAYLVSAYYASGHQAIANQMLDEAWPKINDYHDLSHNFGSTFRDKSTLVYLLSKIKNTSLLKEYMESIQKRLAKEGWLSTQETAWGLMAAVQFYGNNVHQQYEHVVSIDSKVIKNVKATHPFYQLTHALEGRKTSSNIEVKNKSSIPLYITIIEEGTPLHGDATEYDNGIEMDVVWENDKGKPVDVSQLKQGEDFTAKVVLMNTSQRDYEEMVLRLVFPPGWEIQNDRMSQSSIQKSTFDYQDVKDDRVYTFYDIKKSREKVFKIRLTAAYIGEYQMPSIYTEAMYDNKINAKSPGFKVAVVK